MRLQNAGSVILLFVLTLASTATGDDTNIARELAEQLRLAKQSNQLKDFRIGVKVESGVVWLRGTVKNKQQQQKALKLARQISGVKLVVNDIDVEAANESAAAGPMPSTSTTMLPAPPPPMNVPAPQPVAESGRKTAQTVQQAIPLPAPAPAPAAATSIEAVPAQHVRTSAPAMVPAAQAQALAQARADLAAARAEATAHAEALAEAQVQVQAQALAQAQAQATPQPQPRLSPAARAPAPVSMPVVRPVQYEGQVVTGGCGVGGCDCGAGGYGSGMGEPMPEYGLGAAYGGAGYAAGGYAGVSYEQPQLPGHAWPSYAAYPNYGAVTYPKQYSPMAWPYIGPFYPYPQVPMGWRKVCLEWDDGWWFLDFKSK